jgi:hypothetical protein
MQNRHFRRIVASVLIIALSSIGMLNSMAVLAEETPSAGNPKVVKNAKIDTQIVGQLTVIGSVTLNDKRALNGTSVFNNSKIKVACAKGNGAIVNLGRMGRVELSPGAHIVLRFSEGLISGDLMEGNVMVNAPSGVKVSINTQDGVTATDGKEASVLPVKSQRGVRCVPMVISSSSSSPVLSTGAWAALLLGMGGAAVAGVLAATGNEVSPTQIGPPPQNQNPNQ